MRRLQGGRQHEEQETPSILEIIWRKVMMAVTAQHCGQIIRIVQKGSCDIRREHASIAGMCDPALELFDSA